MGKGYLKLLLKKRGYSLIEMIVAIGSASIILLLLSNLLKISEASLNKNSDLNFIDSGYTYGSEYIRNEISAANEIIPLKLKNSLGFLILNIDGTDRKKPYHYIYYRFKNHTVQRVALRSSVRKNPESFAQYREGANILIGNVERVSSKFEDGIISIKIDLKRGSSTRTYICEVVVRCI